MPPTDLGFTHVFVPSDGKSPNDVTLLLLHGTGADEHDLLPIGKQLWPGAALLSPRGRVLENGMPRFFRRFSEGVFDIEDLKTRTNELSAFIQEASSHYRFSAKNVVAVGYSNGANIAASLILLHPKQLRAAVLFRPMVPFEPDNIPDLSALSVFISAGKRDPIAGTEQPKRLKVIFEQGGSDVAMFWHQGGHELGIDDIEAAKDWLSEEKLRVKLRT